MSCLFCFNIRPDALGTGYNLWCPVSSSSFFLPLNTFTRSHRLILKEIPICLMLGNLICPIPDLCKSLPLTWCRSSRKLWVIHWKWCHGLPISLMAMAMRWPSGVSFCSCCVSPSTILIRMRVAESVPIRTCSFSQVIHFGLSKPSAL